MAKSDSLFSIAIAMDDAAAIQQLKAFSEKVRKQMVVRVLKRVSAPIVAEVRPIAPIRTGALRAAMGAKVKSYPSGAAVAIVGARWSYGKTGSSFTSAGIIPSYYLHLVENNVRGQTKSFRARRGPRKVWTVIRHGRGPTYGLHFISSVRERTRKTYMTRLTSEINTEIEREIAKG
jgi:hypothetical protein